MKKLIFSLIISLGCGLLLHSQIITNKSGSEYQFTAIKDIEVTSVGNQNKSSTCWSYSSMSFFESELMRKGNDSVKLAPMYVVRKAYEDKAEKYVRMHGTTALSPGGAFHDAVYVWKKYGIVPLSADMSDETTGDPNPVHNELDGMIKTMADQAIKAKNNGKLSNVWHKAIKNMLDAYLGPEPTEFVYKGKKYTPQTFAQSLGLNMDDYVMVTSFNHHPFYQQFALEVPDNWMWGLCHNVPVDEMKQILDNALTNGYGVAWGADVSEKYFSWKNGIAVVPADPQWAELSQADKDKSLNAPIKQLEITQEVRQTAFDNYETEDDHGMHLTGIFKDQQGNVFYKVKNSWGTAGNECGGYMYASQQYVLYKTTNILVHKNAIPDAIAKKMGIKK